MLRFTFIRNFKPSNRDHHLDPQLRQFTRIFLDGNLVSYLNFAERKALLLADGCERIELCGAMATIDSVRITANIDSGSQDVPLNASKRARRRKGQPVK